MDFQNLKKYLGITALILSLSYTASVFSDGNVNPHKWVADTKDAAAAAAKQAAKEAKAAAKAKAEAAAAAIAERAAKDKAKADALAAAIAEQAVAAEEAKQAAERQAAERRQAIEEAPAGQDADARATAVTDAAEEAAERRDIVQRAAVEKAAERRDMGTAIAEAEEAKAAEEAEEFTRAIDHALSPQEQVAERIALEQAEQEPANAANTVTDGAKRCERNAKGNQCVNKNEQTKSAQNPFTCDDAVGSLTKLDFTKKITSACGEKLYGSNALFTGVGTAGALIIANDRDKSAADAADFATKISGIATLYNGTKALNCNAKIKKCKKACVTKFQPSSTNIDVAKDEANVATAFYDGTCKPLIEKVAAYTAQAGHASLAALTSAYTAKFLKDRDKDKDKEKKKQKASAPREAEGSVVGFGDNPNIFSRTGKDAMAGNQDNPNDNVGLGDPSDDEDPENERTPTVPKTAKEDSDKGSSPATGTGGTGGTSSGIDALAGNDDNDGDDNELRRTRSPNYRFRSGRGLQSRKSSAGRNNNRQSQNYKKQPGTSKLKKRFSPAKRKLSSLQRRNGNIFEHMSTLIVSYCVDGKDNCY